MKLTSEWNRRFKGFAFGAVVLGDLVFTWDSALTAHALAGGELRWAHKPKTIGSRTQGGAVATESSFVVRFDERGPDQILLWLDPASGKERARTLVPSPEGAIRHGFASSGSTVAMTAWRNPVVFGDDGSRSLLSPIPESTLQLVAEHAPADVTTIRADEGTYFASVMPAGSRFVVGATRPLDTDNQEMFAVAFDARGEKLWSSSAGTPITASEAHVLCASATGVTLLDARDGSALWTQPVLVGAAALAGDVAVVTGYSGPITALSLDGGAQRWQVAKADGTATLAFDGEQIWAQVDGQPLVALSGADGAELARAEATSRSARPITVAGTRVLATEDGSNETSLRVYEWGGAAVAKPRAAPKVGSLAGRLEAFARVFGARKDVEVLSSQFGEPLEGASFDKRVPKELRELAAASGTIDLSWKRAGAMHAAARLKLDLANATELRDPEDWMEGYAAVAEGVDEIQPECAGWLVVPKGKKTATLAFYDANDGDITPFETPDAYFREAARSAFVFYWPKSSGRIEAESLLAASTEDANDQIALRAGKIVDARTAADLVEWLGDRARILFAR
jgi:outer membrane protein assembly factor BamB